MKAHHVIIAAGGAHAFFPLIPLLIKGLGIGAHKHGVKKLVVDQLKDEAKDKAKDMLKKKDSDKKEKE